jgi:hypothetical protein
LGISYKYDSQKIITRKSEKGNKGERFKGFWSGFRLVNADVCGFYEEEKE